MNTQTEKFISGLELSRLFYVKEVAPIIKKEFPDLLYSAGLIGSGSEVLGFDTILSTDHHWGPRLLIFLSETDMKDSKEKLSKILSDNLSREFMGYSVNFGAPDTIGVRLRQKIESGPVNHMIEFYTIKSFINGQLNVGVDKEWGVKNWLSFPQQKLLEITAGEVFYDGLEELNSIRQKLKFYPKDIWYYLLAVQWNRIAEEEAFVGRTGEVEDEIGSRLVAARQIHRLMQLCFLMENKYWPYSKWFGSGFKRLKSADTLLPIFSDVLSAKNWKERESLLSRAYEFIAETHNSLNITEPLPVKVSSYHNRPYLVIHADKFSEEIQNKISDKELKELSTRIGSVDQFLASSDIENCSELFQNISGPF